MWTGPTMHEETAAHALARPLDISASGDREGRNQLDLQSLLVDVSRLATSQRDLDGLLAALVMLLQRAVRFDRLAVVLHDPSRQVMRLHSLAAVEPVVPTVAEARAGRAP